MAVGRVLRRALTAERFQQKWAPVLRFGNAMNKESRFQQEWAPVLRFGNAMNKESRFQQKWAPVLRFGNAMNKESRFQQSGRRFCGSETRRNRCRCTGDVARKGRYAEARLGKLLSLDRRRRAAPPKVPSAGGGEIVIFTGIRYERRIENDRAGDPPPARPRRKRG